MDALLNESPGEVQVSGGTIRYREIGTGSPVVFVHGLLVNGQLWRKVARPLASHHRCIIPDWPLGSHTVPMRPDADLSPPALARMIAELITALDLSDVTLVANDTGGALCQMLVTSDPSRIERLVLTSCDAYDNFPPLAFRPLLWGARVPGFMWLLSRCLQFPLVQRSPAALGLLVKRPMDQAVVDQYTQPCWRIPGVRRDLTKVLRGISITYTVEAARRLTEFRRPVLIAWAAEDRFFPIAHARRLAETFPHARLELVADSRTFIPEDQPAALAELIHGFVAGSPQATAAGSEETAQPLRGLTSVKRSA